MHSDYCRVSGRTVNDWLSDPGQIPDFLKNLESMGWIKRGENPDNSRLWRLIQSDRAEMFGVFNAYEQQILQDWIWSKPATALNVPCAGHNAPRVVSFRARQRVLDSLGQSSERPDRTGSPREVIRHRFTGEDQSRQGFGSDLRLLEQEVAMSGSKQEAMKTLSALMSSSRHHTSAGLMATRMFSKLLG